MTYFKDKVSEVETFLYEIKRLVVVLNFGHVLSCAWKIPAQEMISQGNHDVASSVLKAKMKMQLSPRNAGDDDDDATLEMNGALPPTKAPTSTKGSTTLAPTELPMGMKLTLMGAPTCGAPAIVPSVIGAKTVKRASSPIGAMSRKNRKVPMDGNTLPADDIVLPYDELEGSEDDVKEECYDDVAPCYDVEEHG